MRAFDGKHIPSKKFKDNYNDIFKKVKHIEDCKKEQQKLKEKK
jgi:hypothetical protein